MMEKDLKIDLEKELIRQISKMERERRSKLIKEGIKNAILKKEIKM